MAWIESHQAIQRHPKTKRLASGLGVHKMQAIGHLHALWWWALDYAPDGDLSEYTVEELVDASEWDRDPQVFVDALLYSGYADESMQLHDWWQYAGKLQERREKNAERMRETRAKSPNKTRVKHVQRTCKTTSDARVGLPTVPNQPTKPTATTAHAHEDARILPPLPDDLSNADPYAEVDARMSMHTGKDFAAKDKDYTAIKSLLASGVPLDFILAGIDASFERNPRINTFAYCAKVIEDRWAAEQAKQAPAQIITFQRQGVNDAPRAGPVLDADDLEDEEFRRQVVAQTYELHGIRSD